MLAMNEFDIRIGTHLTHVAVGMKLLDHAGSLIATRANEPLGNLLLVTDSNVGPIYAERVCDTLVKVGCTVQTIVLPAGESTKCLETIDTLYAALAAHEVGRDGMLVALGGGVVSDVAGFTAATWKRGIRWAILPTTLEADIDAALGGKTAINLPSGKNLAGAFHHPVLVAIDPACLSTLSARDVRAGLGESVKHALIRSESFLSWHEENTSAILALQPEVTEELIGRNVAIKIEIVERDPNEITGERMWLNFGHTIGHAIESCCDYSLRHGECVALGMLAACRLSVDVGTLRRSVVDRIHKLLEAFDLPTVLPKPIDPDRIITAIRSDKKSQRGVARFVLLKEIGQPEVRSDVATSAVRAAFETLLP